MKNMMFKDLVKILKDVPILLTPEISMTRGGKSYTAEGMAVQKAREDGSVMKYTALNYNCDDIARGLLHESIHHWYGGTDEWYVEQVEKIYWEKPEYKALCQRKIVRLLGLENL